jgi:hypothetical protein
VPSRVVTAGADVDACGFTFAASETFLHGSCDAIVVFCLEGATEGSAGVDYNNEWLANVFVVELSRNVSTA